MALAQGTRSAKPSPAKTRKEKQAMARLRAAIASKNARDAAGRASLNLHEGQQVRQQVARTYGTPGAAAQASSPAAQAALRDVYAAGINAEPKRVLNFGERLGADLALAALGAPYGVFQAGKALGLDARDVATGRDFTPGRTVGLGETLGRQVGHDVTHPGEHPGNLLLDALAAASLGAGGVARAGALSRALGEGAGVRAALTRPAAEGGSLLRAPNPGRMDIGGVEVPLSRNALVRATQRARFNLAQNAAQREGAGARVAEAVGAGRGSLASRVGFERARQERIVNAVERAPAEGLAKRASKLNDVEQTAIRVVGEKQPIADRIAGHERDILATAGNNSARAKMTRRRLRQRVNLLRKVEDQGLVVKGPDGAPIINPANAKLAETYKRTVASGGLGGRRQRILEQAGQLNPETAAERINAPGRVIAGEPVRETPQMSLLETPGSTRTPNPGEVFFSNAPKKGIRTGAARVGNRQSVGIPKAPGCVTPVYTGVSNRCGQFRNDAVAGVAESELEAQRFGAVLRGHKTALKDSVGGDDYLNLPTRQQGHYIPVRVTTKPYSPQTRQLLDAIREKKAHGGKLTKTERRELERADEEVRSYLFPDITTDEAIQLAKKGEVRFVDERRLGGINKQPLGTQSRVGRGLGKAGDEFNAAQQIAVLFVKGASYFAPNALGQDALTVIQQGWAAPRNLTRAARVFRELHPEERQAGGGAIGTGFARAANMEGFHGLTSVRNKIASGYSKIIDSPTRWPAFFHEANKLGYKTADDIRSLLTDEAKRGDLLEVAQRTRDAMIDYERMGPTERAVIRRLIFFYPWLKGSSQYTGRFIRDNPVQAAVVGNLGQKGSEDAKRQLGEVPFYRQGIFPVGKDSQGRTTVVDPRSAQLFDAPVEFGQIGVGTIRSLLKGERPDVGVGDILSPIATDVSLLVNPRDTLTGQELSLRDALTRAHVTGTPLGRFLREKGRIGTDQANREIPATNASVYGRFLGPGGLYPTPMNKDVLNENAAKRDKESLSGPDRTARTVFDERTAYYEAAKKHAADELEDGKLPKVIRDAFNRKAQRLSTYSRIREKNGGITQRDRYEADVRMFKQWGLVDNAAAAAALQWVRTASDDDIRKQRTSWSNGSDGLFRKAYLDSLLYAKHGLEARGAELP